jgi:hypothetical protein
MAGVGCGLLTFALPRSTAPNGPKADADFRAVERNAA